MQNDTCKKIPIHPQVATFHLKFSFAQKQTKNLLNKFFKIQKLAKKIKTSLKS